jgi:hypothetical protein
MQNLARWLGKLGAVLMAVLAALWIYQAQPDDSPAGRDLARTICRSMLLSDGAAAAMNSPILGPDLRLRLLECERNPRLRWDQALLNRGIAGGAAALLFLLLAALIPQAEARGAAARLAEEEAEAIEAMILEEQAKAVRDTRVAISRKEAILRARRRMHGA